MPRRCPFRGRQGTGEPDLWTADLLWTTDAPASEGAGQLAAAFGLLPAVVEEDFSFDDDDDEPEDDDPDDESDDEPEEEVVFDVLSDDEDDPLDDELSADEADVRLSVR